MVKLLKRIARKGWNIISGKGGNANTSKFENNPGYCCICEADTTFYIYGDRLRRDYKCEKCQTQPRNRALVNAMNKFTRDWRDLKMHESSPGGNLSKFLKENCKYYSSSHYFNDVPRGEYKDGHRSEDLSRLTFEDESFDVFVTSDVFEHVFEPAKAFSEINRVLKPGGVHIFTMPWYPNQRKSFQRAKLLEDGTIEYLAEADYHGNPIDKKGALVTFDWGLDFTEFIFRNGGMSTEIYLEIDRKKGLDGLFLEVFISRKPDAAK